MAFDLPDTPVTGESYALGGHIWQYDGAAWAAVGAGSPGIRVQTFTATGTYTPSPGMKYAMIECVGSGGAGAGVTNDITSNVFAGGGGGAGGYSRKLVSAAAVGASQAVTIGAAATSGSNGSATSVGSLCVANGGAQASVNSFIPGVGGTAGTGDVASPGMVGDGGLFHTGMTPAVTGGSGGSTLFGSGGAGAGDDGAGGNAVGYGGGGGGCAATNTGTDFAGGTSGAGFVVITEFMGTGTGVTSTDNAIARYDGTTGILQDSTVTISDDAGVGSPTLNVVSTTAEAQGPGLMLTHSSPSQANGDIPGTIVFSGLDSAATAETYGIIYVLVDDITSGSEDSHFRFRTRNAGADSEMILQPGGIGFPATQVSSAGANVLDDYEEGTWTAAFNGSGTAGVFVYDVQESYYTKIGRNVYVNGRLRTDDITTAPVGNMNITGLPFAAINATNADTVGCGVVGAATYAGDIPCFIRASDNATTITLLYLTAANTELLVLQGSDLQDAANSNNTFWGMTYITAT